MSKRLQVNDTTALAFGFTWQALDPMESRSAKLAELLGQGNKWQASFKRNGDQYLGVSKEDFRPLPKIKTVSGAALMANHPSLAGKTVWIVMEEPVDEVHADEPPVKTEGVPSPAAKPVQSEIIVVGLLNGNIVVDDYVNKAGYQRAMASFIERCSKAKASYTTVGTSYTLGRVHQAYTWTDLLAPKGLKTVPVKTLEPSMYGRVLGVAAAVATVSGLVWAYTAWDEAQRMEAERLRREQAARNIPALYTASVNDIIARPVLQANKVFLELRKQLGFFPTHLAGWNLESIVCAAQTTACVGTWGNREKQGTNRGFAAAAPSSWGAITFAPSGEVATHVLPFKLTAALLPARESWPVGSDFLLKQFSEWQKYWIVGFRPVLADRPSVVGLVPGLDESTAATLPDVVWATVWRIDATDWDLSDGFDTAAEKGDGNLPDSVTVEGLTLKATKDGHLKFDANGLIYERK